LATAGSNYVHAVTATETASRQAFDSGLQAPNGLTLYGQTLYGMDYIAGPVQAVPLNSTVAWVNPVTVYAYWWQVILNADGSVNTNQVPNYGGYAYGPYAWVVTSSNTYDWSAMENWSGLPSGDSFVDIGPDSQPSCQWSGYNWQSSGVEETDPNGNYFYPVQSDNSSASYVGQYWEQDNVTPVITVDPYGNVSYEIPWTPQYTALEQYYVSLADSGLSFSISASVGLPDVFLTQLAVPTPGHNGEYGAQAWADDWTSTQYGAGTWNFSPPWEVTGSPSLTINYASYGNDVIDNPCQGGSSGPVAWDNLDNDYQGYVLNPTWFLVPTYYDTTNLVDGLLAPVASLATQTETDAQTGIAAAGNAQATANLALVQMQQPDGKASLCLTNGDLRQFNSILTNSSLQLVVTAVSPDFQSQMPVGSIYNGSGFGDTNCMWQFAAPYGGIYYLFNNTGWASPYRPGHLTLIYDSNPAHWIASDNAFTGPWQNAFPFTFTFAGDEYSITLDYVKMPGLASCVVPTSLEVSNMIAAAIFAYTNSLHH